MERPSRVPRDLRWAPAATLTAALVGSGVLLAQSARALWFFGDDFEFLLHRTWAVAGPHGLLEPHNEHWSTLPIALFRLCFDMFGMHHYLPYALLPISFHLVTATFLFLILRRVGVAPWVGVLAVLVALFVGGGAGAENTLWDFQAGFLGSAVFGVLGLWLLSDHEGRHRPLAVASLILALMSSGMGLLMVVWAGAYVLLREGLRCAALTVSLPALVYVCWYVTYGHGHSGAPPVVLSIAPSVAMKGLGELWSSATGMPAAGPTILLLAALAVALPRTSPGLFALAASGLVTVVAGYLLFGFSRSGLGIDAATASRYVYFGVLFTLPALSVGLEVVASWLRPRNWAGPLAWLLLGVLVVSVGSAQVVQFRDHRRDQIGDTRERIVAAARLIAEGEPLLRSQPSPVLNPDINTEAVRDVARAGALPDAVPGRRAVLNAAANLQVDVRHESFGFRPPTRVTWSGFAASPHGMEGSNASQCEVRYSDVGGRIEITLGSEPTQLRIALTGDRFDALLKSGAAKSELVRWDVRPNDFVYLGATAENETLLLRFPRGSVTICRD